MGTPFTFKDLGSGGLCVSRVNKTTKVKGAANSTPQKESPAYVQEQLAHASIQLMVDAYGHLVPGSNRSAVDRLDDFSMHPAAPPAPSPLR
jgi:hypothetical protein